MKRYTQYFRRSMGLCLVWVSMSGLPPAQAENARQQTADLADPKPLAPAIVELVRTNARLVLSQRIGIVTNAPITPTEKVQALISMLPTEEREGQRKLLHVAMRWTDDASYPVVRRVLLDPKWHPQIHSVLMTGTLKRRNQVKLPVLLELARSEGHPLRAEATQLLEHFLGKDHGEDWAAWQKSLSAWLAQHPD